MRKRIKKFFSYIFHSCVWVMEAIFWLIRCIVEILVYIVVIIMESLG